MPPPYRRSRTDSRVEDAVAADGRLPDDVLPVLQAVQEKCNHLDRASLGAIADKLRMNDARVFGVASFYSMLSLEPRAAHVFRVCDSPVCMLHGAADARKVAEQEFASSKCTLVRTSCLGLCDRAPAALHNLEPWGPLPLQPGKRLGDDRSVSCPSYANALPGEVRVSMARLGSIDPDSIDSVLAAGGYRTLQSTLRQTPAQIVDVIDRSGLRGCGGAGFPAGRKWRMVAEATGSPKYLVCNADESEPGTFKDRVLMDGDPHLLLEGMALAGFAIGANTGIIYIRGEYEWIARRLERAVAQAEEHGWLGTRIQGTPFSFHVHVHRGAGAYICGEETALLNSLEGLRGEPRIRPPYPTTHGLHGNPTLVNNVETLCLVPCILSRGSEWFRTLGTARSPGTKLFAVTGCINRPGVYEAPMGITLREIIDHFGGGMRSGTHFKAALTGGAAGTFVSPSLIDVPIDFDSHRQGVALGSGAILILDESASIPEVLSWLLRFFEAESCGKCTPCREGTREVRQLCEQIVAGRNNTADVEELARLARIIEVASLCGLGRSVAWPVLSALRHFPVEFALNAASSS